MGKHAHKPTNYTQQKNVFVSFASRVTSIQAIKESKEVQKSIMATLLGKILPKRSAVKRKVI